MAEMTDSAADALRLAAMGLVLVRAAQQKNPCKSNEAIRAWVDRHLATLRRQPADPYPEDADLRAAVLAAAAELDVAADEDSQARHLAYLTCLKVGELRPGLNSLLAERPSTAELLGAESAPRFGSPLQVFLLALAGAAVGYFTARGIATSLQGSGKKRRS